MATTFLAKTALGVAQVEPALTPPTVKPTLPKKPKLGSGRSRDRKREIPEGLWIKCPSCSAMVFDSELDANLKVCTKCSHHFRRIPELEFHEDQLYERANRIEQLLNDVRKGSIENE